MFNGIIDGDFIEIFGDSNLYYVYKDDFGNLCVHIKDEEVRVNYIDKGIFCRYNGDDVNSKGFKLATPKEDGVVEGEYVSLYCDSNIYYVYSELGRLYIDFRGSKRYLDSFGGTLYKGYSFDELNTIKVVL